MLKCILKCILNAFFPTRCPYCDEYIFIDNEACEECTGKLNYEYIVTCLYGNCKNISPFKYDGIYKKAVLNFKFNNNPHYAQQMSISMQKAIYKEFSEFLTDENKFDIITCVPCTRNRYYMRGYNQSQLLAKSLADAFNIPFIPILEKIKDTESQHTLPKEKRKTNVEGVFAVNAEYDIKDKKILLIDDIITTGSTLNECINILYKANAQTVMCATYATALSKC